MLDNSEKLREMVNNAHAHSTQLGDSETVKELTAKTEPASAKWEPVAKKLWTASPK